MGGYCGGLLVKVLIIFIHGQMIVNERFFFLSHGRLYPVAPVARVLNEDIILRGYHLPANVCIIMPLYILEL